LPQGGQDDRSSLTPASAPNSRDRSGTETPVSKSERRGAYSTPIKGNVSHRGLRAVLGRGASSTAIWSAAGFGIGANDEGSFAPLNSPTDSEEESEASPGEPGDHAVTVTAVTVTAQVRPGLAFTRYCNAQYCMVYGVKTGARKGG